jgi:integrase
VLRPWPLAWLSPSGPLGWQRSPGSTARNFSRTWQDATESAGLTGFHVHDLRHAGNHIAAATGASLRELMGRMGHSTTRAALIYQHRTIERDRLIAAMMSQIVEAELADPDGPSGTQRAREDRDAS